MFHIPGFNQACWLVVFFYLDVGRCMWKIHTDYLEASSLGPVNDLSWAMTGSIYDENYCPLNAVGLYPYLVKIHTDDPDLKRQIRTGVLLSHRAVLTTYVGFRYVPINTLRVFAQRQFKKEKGSRRTDYCYQFRLVDKMIPHPSVEYIQDRYVPFWDFQVLVLEKKFYAEKEFAYPVIQIPKQPYHLWQYIRTLLIMPLPMEGCEMPYFVVPETKYPILEYREAGVDVMKTDYHGCGNAFCWNKVGFQVLECMDKVHTFMDNTFLCIHTRWRTQWPRFQDVAIPELGFPLVCNNTGIGIGVHAWQQIIMHLRKDGYGISPDLIFVPTFLRIWPWLMEMKRTYWEKNYNRQGPWDSPNLGRHEWRRFVYTTPKWNKNVDKDLKRFHIKLRIKQSHSDGNGIHSTRSVVSLFSMHVSLIPIIWII